MQRKRKQRGRTLTDKLGEEHVGVQLNIFSILLWIWKNISKMRGKCLC